VLVLLIACANLANLLLLRGEDRRAQFALRMALGAPRGRLVRQIAVEAMLLCVVGGTAGVVIARWSVGAVTAFAPAAWPRLDDLNVGGPVMLFGALATLLASVISALVPAVVATRVTAGVPSGGAARVTSAAFRRGRRAFVVLQVALAITILAAAAVLTRSVLRLQSADMGFAADRLAFAELLLPLAKYQEATVRRSFFEELTTRVRAIPGVEAAVPIAVQPYAGLSGWDMPRWIAEGQSADEATRNPGLDLQSVYPDHFETMAIPVIEGRGFTRFDRQGALPVAVISANAARQVWPGQNAIGKRLRWGGIDSDGPWFTIVGIAATTRYRELADPRATVYLPAAQFVDGANSLALRLAGPLTAITGELRRRVAELDGEVFVVRAQPFADLAARPLARPRFVSLLANIFGATALLLAMVGLYGVMAVFVRQSTREIGVRVALGATAGHVRGLVAGEAARLAGLGVVLGLAGALGTGRLLAGLLFGVAPLDPLAMGAAITLLTAAAAAACYIPLRHAIRIDPAILLRAE
jgi:predicted permease